MQVYLVQRAFVAAQGLSEFLLSVHLRLSLSSAFHLIYGTRFVPSVRSFGCR